MSERMQYLVSLFNGVFSYSFTEPLALKTRFKTRSGKLTPNMFLALCVLHGKDLCLTTLSELSTRLEVKEGIRLSPQALDQRFNKYAVDFLREIFESIMREHNKEINDHPLLQNMLFSKIKSVDSTNIQLPANLASTYKGSGGDSSAAAIKIQLEYEILSGKFMVCQLYNGTTSDTAYLPFSEERIEKGELHLKDLGYFKAEHLNKINQSQAFYISKLKQHAAIYLKNTEPKLKKDGTINRNTLYEKIDIQEISQPLAEGQSIEYLDTYIGRTKLMSRLIITKLRPESKKSRVKKRKLKIRKGNKIAYKDDDHWDSINYYITNIPPQMATTDQIHHLYTLRWQIENMFKVWKSVFRLADVKKVKLERFQCFLYGRLIELALSASIVSTSKAIAIMEGISSPLSEHKSFAIVSEYLESFIPNKYTKEQTCKRFLVKIIRRILKYGRKASKKGATSFKSILDFLRYSPLQEIVV